MKNFKLFKKIVSITIALSLVLLNFTPFINNTLVLAKEEIKTRVVVKIEDNADITYENNIKDSKELIKQYPQLNEVLDKYPHLEFEQLFESIEEEQVQESNTYYSESSESDVSNLLNYYVVEVSNESQGRIIVEVLEKLDFIETAYIEGKPVQPTSVYPYDDPRYPRQGYLKPAPLGIDAEYAWKLKGGDGKGITFVDVEQGWALNHEDLIEKDIKLISGVNRMFYEHGTSVLGEVVAMDNNIGNVGITPNANAKVVSQWRTNSKYSTADAILSAVNNMNPGDVLLLEAQTNYSGYSSYLPVEVEPAVFDAIRFGTDKGIVIVEAAGNGSNDLDNFKDIHGKQVLNRNSRDFKDSGAIMVGAATSSVPHQKSKFSNYGSRIDTYGWGDSIDTLSGTPEKPNLYTSYFNGTSGASPIVSGAAIAIQGIAKEMFGKVYSPEKLRDILSDPSTGTLSANPTNDKIGVMPNLKAILDKIIGSSDEIDKELPNAPSDLTYTSKTEKNISLKWNESTDNIKVEKYEVYRDNKFIGFSRTRTYEDVDLEPDKEYKYYVVAIDSSGNKSLPSNEIAVKTDPSKVTTYPEWDSNKAYNGGDIVTYKGITYRAKWWSVPGYAPDTKVINEWETPWEVYKY
ncbi:hypothetical protein CLPU_10c00290 [Gottschalkia purinilytica]|uniref:Fibronectin type-III domain-containing protein n=1 Tax=Gottschalkia purinilytica TaxID=1503 RepID=A0A0L0W9K0_GOTPU|nr:S8 family serine peptidase [Gottschalkia purinilytica]KNF07975.1 hypothetical protein CLPU_10c00290 [Gottschalkia purinilytica]